MSEKTKTPREMAEEYVLRAELHTPFEPSFRERLLQNGVRSREFLAFMACYDAMVGGEPDGWVRDREWKGQLIKGKELFDSPQKAREGFSEDYCTMEENGFRIVPVKLIRCEG